MVKLHVAIFPNLNKIEEAGILNIEQIFKEEVIEKLNLSLCGEMG
jgi:hypothetical protein